MIPAATAIISPAHGASVEPQGAELQPRGPPPAASVRRPAAAPETRAAEARKDSRRRPSGPPLGAIPWATHHISVSRSAHLWACMVPNILSSMVGCRKCDVREGARQPPREWSCYWLLSDRSSRRAGSSMVSTERHHNGCDVIERPCMEGRRGQQSGSLLLPLC